MSVVKYLVDLGADLVNFMSDLETVNATENVRRLAESVNHFCGEVGYFSSPDMDVADWYRAFSFVKLCGRCTLPSAISVQDGDGGEGASGTAGAVSAQAEAERCNFEHYLGVLVHGYQLHRFHRTKDFATKQNIMHLVRPLYGLMSAHPMARRARHVSQLMLLFSAPEQLADLFNLRCVCVSTSQSKFPLLRWQKELEAGLIEEFLVDEAWRFVDMEVLKRVRWFNVTGRVEGVVGECEKGTVANSSHSGSRR